MDKTLFEDLQQSLKEAVAIRRSEIAPGKVTEIHTPDAQAIRVKVALLRNWEQNRRKPTGAAAALLTIVEKEPAAALRALH